MLRLGGSTLDEENLLVATLVMESQLFPTVLLVEDDASHALLITRALKRHAGEVVRAETAVKGLSFLRDREFSLIVSDLHLPDSSGTEHLLELKALGGETPIVVLTSSTSVNDAVGAMKLGASDFIVKNFDANFNELFDLSLNRVHHAHRLSRERAKLQREMASLRIAIENSTDGLALLLGDGTIEYSNTAFSEFIEKCGGKVNDLASLFSEKVLNNVELRQSLDRRRREMSTGSAWHTEVRFKEAKERAYGLTISVIRPAEYSGANECVLWARDISEQKRREKFQRELLSTTTHDLKGPLGAIMISAELVGDLIKDQPKPAGLVLRIASSAQGAVNLIDEFLSARRLQEGTFILKPKEQPLSIVAQEAIDPFAPVAESRGISLSVESEGECLAIVDKLGIQRVLSNLVSNALKFTPKGGKVTVQIFSRGDEHHIQVADTGAGLEPAEVSKLFERFSRLDKHSEVAGTGLGLFVVKSIVTAHGGRVDVLSKLGEGTTFDIAIPRQPPVNDRGELISLDFA